MKAGKRMRKPRSEVKRAGGEDEKNGEENEKTEE